MKWPSVLRAVEARTFHRTAARENAQRNGRKSGGETRSMQSPERRSIRLHLQNPFVAIVRADGENDFPRHHIRNSISLTVRQSRRMICASHQHRAGRRWKEFL
jgi:hypothetical protein